MTEYLHVKNLEKYHPSYKDRELKWAKIYFQMVQGDPDCEMIENEIDWARLVKFIILELQAKGPIPLTDKYLKKKGFDLKKRPISLTVKMLQKFVIIVTEPLRNRDVEIEEDIEIEVEEEAVTADEVMNLWNSFAKSNGLSEIKAILSKRKLNLSRRLKEPHFDFPKILEAVSRSNFLLGKIQGKEWKVDFDFIVRNTDNYLKILEGRYSDAEKNNNHKIKFPEH